MRAIQITVVGAVLITACSVRVSGGQSFPQQPIQMPSGHQTPGLPSSGNPNPAEPDPLGLHRAEQQEKLRNNDRQKRLVADTEKLLVLATDLKEQVDKTNKDVLSVDVIKKADEIEKLAHSVKERMKG